MFYADTTLSLFNFSPSPQQQDDVLGIVCADESLLPPCPVHVEDQLHTSFTHWINITVYPRLHEAPVVEGGGLITHHITRNGQLKSSGLLLQKLLHDKHIANQWYHYNASVKKCTLISAFTQSILRSCETRDQ